MFQPFFHTKQKKKNMTVSTSNQTPTITTKKQFINNISITENFDFDSSAHFAKTNKGKNSV